MFIIIWEYIAIEGRESEFEKIYSADGEWVQLFQQSDGYLGTELLRDLNHPRHYITIDRWISSAAFDSFKEKHGAEYEALDVRCEHLTEHEIRLGAGTPPVVL